MLVFIHSTDQKLAARGIVALHAAISSSFIWSRTVQQNAPAMWHQRFACLGLLPAFWLKPHVEPAGDDESYESKLQNSQAALKLWPLEEKLHVLQRPNVSTTTAPADLLAALQPSLLLWLVSPGRHGCCMLDVVSLACLRVISPQA